MFVLYCAVQLICFLCLFVGCTDRKYIILRKARSLNIPDWLKRIHQHREDLATTTDATDFESLSQVAEM